MSDLYHQHPFIILWEIPEYLIQNSSIATLPLNFIEIGCLDFAQSCWQTNKQTNESRAHTSAKEVKLRNNSLYKYLFKSEEHRKQCITVQILPAWTIYSDFVFVCWWRLSVCVRWVDSVRMSGKETTLMTKTRTCPPLPLDELRPLHTLSSLQVSHHLSSTVSAWSICNITHCMIHIRWFLRVLPDSGPEPEPEPAERKGDAWIHQRLWDLQFSVVLPRGLHAAGLRHLAQVGHNAHVSMFSSAFVCLLAGFCKNYSTDLVKCFVPLLNVYHCKYHRLQYLTYVTRKKTFLDQFFLCEILICQFELEQFL